MWTKPNFRYLCSQKLWTTLNWEATSSFWELCRNCHKASTLASCCKVKSRTLTITWTDKASKRWLQSASTKINSITLTAYVRAVTWLNTTKRGSKSSFWKNRGVKIATQSCNQANQKTLNLKKENQATERIQSDVLWKSN